MSPLTTNRKLWAGERGCQSLSAPMYSPEIDGLPESEIRLWEATYTADGLILGYARRAGVKAVALTKL